MRTSLSRCVLLLLLLLPLAACETPTRPGTAATPTAEAVPPAGGSVTVAPALAALANGTGPFTGHVVSLPGHGENGDVEVTFLQEGPNYTGIIKFTGRLEVVTGRLAGTIDNWSILPDPGQTPTGTRCGYHAFNGKWSQARNEGVLYDVLTLDFEGLGPDPCSNKKGSAIIFRRAIELPPTLACGAVTVGVVAVPFNTKLIASGGVPPYVVYYVTSGAVPPGLVLDAGSGIISGAPLTAGTFDVAFAVVDSRGASGGTSAAVSCRIRIDPPPCVDGLPLIFPPHNGIASYPPGVPENPDYPTQRGPFPYAIPAGTWRIQAVTGDDHLTKRDPAQLHEQLDFVTDTLLVIGNTTDVPDDRVEYSRILTDFGNVTFTRAVSTILVRHSPFPVTEPNDSVEPISFTYSCPVVAPAAKR